MIKSQQFTAPLPVVGGEKHIAIITKTGGFRFVSEEHGFSIDVALDESNAIYTLAMFFLEMTDDFSPNINVQSQPFVGSLAEYDNISVAQFNEWGMEIVQHNSNEEEIMYEYRGVMQNLRMHWYARALKRGDFIYLVTACALESQWSDVGQRLIDSVNSSIFDIEPEE